MKMGRGWRGATVVLVVVTGVGAGDVTWSAGRDSGTVCSVGRIVVDIFNTSTLNTQLAYGDPSHPLLPPRSQPCLQPRAHPEISLEWVASAPCADCCHINTNKDSRLAVYRDAAD